MGEYSKRFYNIKNDREFRFLFKKGETCVNYGFVCYFRKNGRRRNRCGISTGKKIGGAVVRNRARRVIREAFRFLDHDLREMGVPCCDFIFVARTKTAQLKSTQVLGLMKSRLLPMLKGTNKNVAPEAEKPQRQ